MKKLVHFFWNSDGLFRYTNISCRSSATEECFLFLFFFSRKKSVSKSMIFIFVLSYRYVFHKRIFLDEEKKWWRRASWSLAVDLFLLWIFIFFSPSNSTRLWMFLDVYSRHFISLYWSPANSLFKFFSFVKSHTLYQQKNEEWSVLFGYDAIAKNAGALMNCQKCFDFTTVRFKFCSSYNATVCSKFEHNMKKWRVFVFAIEIGANLNYL